MTNLTRYHGVTAGPTVAEGIARLTAGVPCMAFSTDRIRVYSEANLREHWAAKNRRKKLQQDTLASLLIGKTPPPPGLWCITWTRYFKGRAMDRDNLAGAFKHVQDGLAKWLGMDDGDDRLEWVYEQERFTKHGIGFRVEDRR